MSPPVNQLGNTMVLPPPPPPQRYPTSNTLPPPPSGPPPGSAIGQQAPWSSAWGNRMGYAVPPPPPLIPGGGMINPNAPVPAQRPYNPQAHANMNNASAPAAPTSMPPPPPMQIPGTGMEMSATYIPGIDTFGEGVGIPGLGGIVTEEPTPYSAHSQSKPPPWGGLSPNSNELSAAPTSASASQAGTPLDEQSSRQTSGNTTNNNNLAPHSNHNNGHALGGHGMSISSNASSSRGVPPEMASQWPIERVLSWLQANQFPKDWYDAFQNLELCSTHFLELGSAHGGRGNFSLMHQQVYPTLKQLWMARTGLPGEMWEPTRDREEGRRMRHLIRSIVSGRPVDPSKFTSPSSATASNSSSGQQSTAAPSATAAPPHTSHAAHARKESTSMSHPMSAPGQNLSAHSLPSAGAESDSPNTPIKTPGPGFSSRRVSNLPPSLNSPNSATAPGLNSGDNHRSVFKNIDGDSVRSRHSPNTSDVGLAGSPAGSPVPNSGNLYTGTSATSNLSASPHQSRFAHHRSRNSTDSVSSNAAIYGSGLPLEVMRQLNIGDMTP